MTDTEPPSEGNESRNETWYERTRYQILLFAVGIALFVLIGGLILDWYIAPKTSGQKKDLVQALGLITAGAAGAVGIYFTWRGQRITQREQERSQRNTQEQLSLARQAQITERFTRAIDQLGNESLEIRLGGIYALERIARESEEDHWPIMEVLTAYVRQHAHWSRYEAEMNAAEASRAEFQITEEPAPTPDIQAIVAVLWRRTRSQAQGEPEPLNLFQTNLRGANLPGAYLKGANFGGTYLVGANFSGAYLKGADLGSANLQAAQFKGADLREADLAYADLFGAAVWEADLEGANLWGANLSRAFLMDAKLGGANLVHANLSQADLGGADLRGAKHLTQEQLEETTGDANTWLPPHLKPPADWGVMTDEQPEED